MGKKKRDRIFTKRFTAEEGNDTAFEFIEREEYNGKDYLYYRCGETVIDLNEGRFKVIEAEACFPISVDLVQERFIEAERKYDPTGKEFAKTVKDLYNK